MFVLALVFEHLICRDALCQKITHFSMAFCIPWFHCLEVNFCISRVYARNSAPCFDFHESMIVYGGLVVHVAGFLFLEGLLELLAM